MVRALDPRPGAAAFARRCRGRTRAPWSIGAAATDPVRAELARQWLVAKLLRRRRWALHRHVHLLAAFEDASSRAPIESVLSAGCGSATSELLLAVDHPDVRFTLTDHDPEQLDRARAIVERFGLRNVVVTQVDLLDPPPLPVHDLVVSIEVLEHIDDDVGAIATIVGLSRRFVWVLVPFCNDREFDDPAVQRAEWERHEHVRPGYPHEVLADRLAGLDVVWQRNCYYQPAASAVRRRLSETGTARLLLDRDELFGAVVRDVRAGRVDDSRAAQGVEVLAELRPRQT